MNKPRILVLGGASSMAAKLAMALVGQGLALVGDTEDYPALAQSSPVLKLSRDFGVDVAYHHPKQKAQWKRERKGRRS